MYPSQGQWGQFNSMPVHAPQGQPFVDPLLRPFPPVMPNPMNLPPHGMPGGPLPSFVPMIQNQAPMNLDPNTQIPPGLMVTYYQNLTSKLDPYTPLDPNFVSMLRMYCCFLHEYPYLNDALESPKPISMESLDYEIELLMRSHESA